MRNASMKVLKNLVCCAAFICLMFVLAMPAHAASKADELLQLVNAERAQAGVAPLSMGSSALNAAAQARAKELTVNYSYNSPNGSREFTILPEYGVDDVSVGENYWAAAENASDVVAAWNRYDFFKERMLDKDATSVGIGYYEGGEYGNYWVMIFTYAAAPVRTVSRRKCWRWSTLSAQRKIWHLWPWAMPSCRPLPMSAQRKWQRSLPTPAPMAPTASPC